MALMLGEQLKELSTLELEFDLETIGFTMGEIDLRIEGLAPSPDADRADTLPPASELTISQTWRLMATRPTPALLQQRVGFPKLCCFDEE